MGAFRKWLIVATLFFGSVVAAGLLSEPNDRPAGSTGGSPAPSGYSHEDLQSDLNMTQQMSTPNANTDSQYHTNDAQLERSQDPGYVRALEQHQADIDRMLGRGSP